ncbi:hypothetical protein Gohar_003760 [Gossypium harknessii]|uniref:RNase H type-1 domain-containing protein n=1 Tax=Gossypium harknessii TaxID=34285 RepID=A0A7J9IAE5_9ROSI|nr:hypothetical protein [Gossypium harknessii]
MLAWDWVGMRLSSLSKHIRIMRVVIGVVLSWFESIFGNVWPLSSTVVGGLLTDFARQWLVGCTKTLGDILLFQAEARSMMEGLKLAQDRGYRKVEVENDNALLIESIYCGISEFNGLAEMQQLNLICDRE